MSESMASESCFVLNPAADSVVANRTKLSGDPGDWGQSFADEVSMDLTIWQVHDWGAPVVSRSGLAVRR